MASAQQKFWKLTIESRLLALDECQRLHADFCRAEKTSSEDASALARWLISEGVLTRYQARVLLAGRAGPFHFGDYTIMDHHGDGKLKGIYHAVSRSAGQRVLLLVVPQAAASDSARLDAHARKAQKLTATGEEQLVSEFVWQNQGSLVFTVLADFDAAPTVVMAPPPIHRAVTPPPPIPVEQPAEPWPAAELPVFHVRTKRRGLGPALMGWGMALVLLLGAGWAWMTIDPTFGGILKGPEERSIANHDDPFPVDSPQPEQADTPQTDPSLTAGRATGPPTVELVEDDGQTLWTSPTSGPPLKLHFLPVGAEAILVLRPAELVSSAEGAKGIEAIGPAGEAAATAIQTITACPWNEIEQLQIGFYPTEAGPVAVAFVVRLAADLTTEAWNARWPDRKPAEHAGKQYFQVDGRAYYFPASEAGRVIVIASPAEIDGVIDADGSPLTKEMERLLVDTDEQRHFTLIAEPFSVFENGRTMFVGELARLAEPLREFVGDGVPAILISGFVDHDLFLELRAYGQADKDPRQLAIHYRQELAALPERFEAYLATLDPAPYGKAVLLRFPRMLERLQASARADAEHHQAVMRCYLPSIAAHNLLLGTELALFELPKQGGKATATPAKQATDVAAALAKPISLSFPRDTLEKCLELLSTEIGVEIAILGSDLQLEGITKNQSFSLDERDQPAEEILMKILKLANTDGKLVYVVKPRAAGGEPIIFVTTRAAAAKRHDTLPAAMEKK
jgi:hypothetical protein